jgi:hypothetical protein
MAPASTPAAGHYGMEFPGQAGRSGRGTSSRGTRLLAVALTVSAGPVLRRFTFRRSVTGAG